MKQSQTAEISGENRIAFVGSTGSGKTTLAEQLTAPLDRLIVFDPKGTLYGKWGLSDWDDRSTPRALASGEPVRARVPMPPTSDPMGAMEAYFYTIYTTGGCTVYIDEVFGIVPPRKAPAPYFSALYTRGRELGIGVWAATQRPYLIPVFCLSEAEWVFVFKLRLEADRKRMAEIIGPEVQKPVKHDHGFYMYYTSWDAPRYVAGLQI